MSKRKFTGYSMRDWIIASVLSVCIFSLCLLNMTSGAAKWGDDYAAYISEGIAIAQGTLEDQAVRNYMLHPSPLPEEAEPEGLVYVWGYPLLLSAVYRIVGFDRTDFSTVIFYKLPSAVCLALLCGVLYLFYRRRFSALMSAAAAFVLCACDDFRLTLNMMYSDLVFLFFAMLVILLTESFLWEGKRPSEPVFRPSVVKGLFLGVAMWFAYEVRLNGSTLVVVALIAHTIYLLSHRSRFSVRMLPRHLLPYAVFIVLVWVSSFFLPSATSNLSDVGSVDLKMIFENTLYYIHHTANFLHDLCRYSVVLLIPIALLLVIGFVTDGFRGCNLHLTFLLLGTYIVLVALPYRQSLRYLYNALPILLLWLLYGIDRLSGSVAARIPAKGARITRAVLSVACCVFCMWTFSCLLVSGIRNVQSDRYVDAPTANPYTDEAIDMYRFIQAETPEDCVICFPKPRALYLNTGRLSIAPGVNGHEMSDGDYALYLKSLESFADGSLVPEEYMELVYENSSFALYANTLR